METNERTITLSDIIEVARRCWYFLLAAFILFGASVIVYSNLTYKEQYTAMSDMFIIKKNSDNYQTGDYNIDLALTYDIIALIQTPNVLDAVIEKVEQERSITGFTGIITRQSLLNSITISNQPDTRLITIENTADTKENAKIISIAICSIAKEKIELLLDADRVNINDLGIVGDKPSNSKYSVVKLLIPFVAVIVVYLVFFIINILDDKIKSIEDCEKYLGVSVLGMIPNIGENGKIKNRYMNSYYSYGKKSQEYSVYGQNLKKAGKGKQK